MNSSEIVGRLRSFSASYQGENVEIRLRDLRIEAASHIEAQDKLLAEMTDAISELRSVHVQGVEHVMDMGHKFDPEQLAASINKANDRLDAVLERAKALSQKDTP